MSYVIVIYGAYGSNLLKERFLAYIKGGTYRGVEYKGCSNKNDPIDLGYIRVPHRVFFAKSSQRWNNKGVAFLSYDKEEDKERWAVIRLWMISEDQFQEIWDQEGRSFYPDLITLGNIQGIGEIKTFTDRSKLQIRQPDEEYTQIIRKGLKETTCWNDEKIDRYIDLCKKP